MKELCDARRRSDQFQLHPLGFFYLQGKAEQGVSRRVHVWLDDDKGGGKNDRHLHSYDIVSHVVAGGQCSELYRFDPTTDGTESEFVVSYRADKSISQPTGRRGILLAVGYFETTVGGELLAKSGGHPSSASESTAVCDGRPNLGAGGADLCLRWRQREATVCPPNGDFGGSRANRGDRRRSGGRIGQEGPTAIRLLAAMCGQRSGEMLRPKGTQHGAVSFHLSRTGGEAAQPD